MRVGEWNGRLLDEFHRASDALALLTQRPVSLIPRRALNLS